ncbi:MAG: hypothetical protein R2823_09495 [Acidimicrobiia bacterium]
MHRRVAIVSILALLVLSACSGSAVDSTGPDSTGSTGDLPTTTVSDMGPGSPDPTLPPSGGGSDCEPDRICEIEYEPTVVPVEGYGLEEIVVDGETAFVTTDDGAVLAIDLTSGAVDGIFTPDSDAVDVTVADGDLWVLTLDGPVFVDRSTMEPAVSGTLPPVATGSHLTVTGDAVWVTTAGTGDVARFNRTTGEFETVITDYPDLVAPGSPRIVAVDGSIYTINEYDGIVLRIDPASNTIIDRFDDLGYEAESNDSGTTSILARGPESIGYFDGSVWVLSDFVNPEGSFVSGNATAYTIDPASGSVSRTLDLVGDPLTEAAFVVTPDALWYIEYTSYNLIRVDRATGLQHRIRAGFSSGYNAAISGGTIWVTTDGALLAVDTAQVQAAVS